MRHWLTPGGCCTDGISASAGGGAGARRGFMGRDRLRVKRAGGICLNDTEPPREKIGCGPPRTSLTLGVGDLTPVIQESWEGMSHLMRRLTNIPHTRSTDTRYIYSAAAGVSGATAASYRLTEAEEGSVVSVRVSFTDDAGYAETLTSAARLRWRRVPTDLPSERRRSAGRRRSARR